MQRGLGSYLDKQFSRKIVFFNFFYSLVMICYHANAEVHFANVTSSGSLADCVMSGVNQVFTGQSGTYFFMMLSAFLLYRDIAPGKMADKVKRRIKTLLVPWVLWNIIGLAANHPFRRGVKEIVGSYVMSRFCEQLWFVEALLLFLFLLPVFVRVLRIRIVGELVVAFLFVVAYLGFPGLRMLPVFPSEKAFNEIMRMLVHLPVYSLGAYLGLNWTEAVVQETYRRKYRWSVVVAVLVVVVSYFPVGNFLCHTCFTLRSAALWVICSKSFFTFEPAWWMQLSFYVYAIHNFILYLTGKCIRLSGIFAKQYASQTVSVGFALLWRICMAAAAFGLALCSAVVLIKITPKFYELLSGGRVPGRYQDRR